MNITEFKSEAHAIIDSVSNETKALKIMTAMKQILNHQEEVSDYELEEELSEIGDLVDSPEEIKAFWSRYTPEQRAELELSFAESEDPNNWVSHETVMKKYALWFNK